MNAYDILKVAQQHGMTLQADGDLLVFEYPENQPPPPDLIDLLRNHKADLLAYLAGQSTPRPASNHTAIQQPQHITGYPLTSDQSRAMNGLWALLERRQKTLIKGGYPPDQALVGVSDWYKVIMNRLHIGRDAMRDIEHSLIMAGLIKIDRHRNYVEPSDGVPMTAEQIEQADHTRLVWGGGDGADFVKWLYS